LVKNWLDTAGYSKGLIFMRWQGLDVLPSQTDWPRARKISVNDLDQYLTPAIPRINAEDRMNQRRERIEGVHGRFGG